MGALFKERVAFIGFTELIENDGGSECVGSANPAGPMQTFFMVHITQQVLM